VNLSFLRRSSGDPAFGRSHPDDVETNGQQEEANSMAEGISGFFAAARHRCGIFIGISCYIIGIQVFVPKFCYIFSGLKGEADPNWMGCTQWIAAAASQ